MPDQGDESLRAQARPVEETDGQTGWDWFMALGCPCAMDPDSAEVLTAEWCVNEPRPGALVDRRPTAGA